jgi:putative ABC transport system permease protein
MLDSGSMSDLQSAVRHMARAPWLTAVIVASMALGTGANAAVYSAVDALLFRAPPGVVDAARLVDLYTSQLNGGTFGNSSYPDFLSIAATASLEAAAAVEEGEVETVRLGDADVTARTAAVSTGFWPLLGLPAAPEGAAAVISEDLWRSLGSDPNIVGRTAKIGAREYVIAAVAPPGFRGLHLARVFDVWVPLDGPGRHGRGDRRLGVIGRLAPNAPIDRLQHELDLIAAGLADAHPATNKGTLRNPEEIRRMTAAAYSRVDPALRSRTALFGAALLGATALLLISACVNAGSLLLSRGMARRTELAIKTALGAERSKLVREAVLGGVFLALTGTVAGLVAASWTASSIPALFAPEHASLLDTRVQRPVIAATLWTGLLAGLMFALVPALLSTRGLSPATLRSDTAGLGDRYGGARLRMLFVGVQLALSTIFLIASVLLVRFCDTTLAVDRSPALGPLVLASVATGDEDYRTIALPRLRALSSVASVGWVAVPPLAIPVRQQFRIQQGALTELVDVDVNFASADYFRAMHIPAIEGRLFRPEEDRPDANVVIVNEALALRYLAGRATGQSLVAANGQTVTIIGSVQTRSYRTFEGTQRPMVYFPISRSIARVFYAAVRFRPAARHPDRDVAVTLAGAGTAKLEVLDFQVFLTRALASDRLIGTLIGACGSIALGLAVIGVYGVMIDAVHRRRREFGLRAALGAGPPHIVAALVGSNLTPAAAGIAAGVAGALLLSRVAASVVYGLPSIDAVLVAEVIVVLLLVVLASMVAPARRAVKVSPLLALRY